MPASFVPAGFSLNVLSSSPVRSSGSTRFVVPADPFFPAGTSIPAVPLGFGLVCSGQLSGIRSEFFGNNVSKNDPLLSMAGLLLSSGVPESSSLPQNVTFLNAPP